jgi:hypothetical protein
MAYYDELRNSMVRFNLCRITSTIALSLLLLAAHLSSPAQTVVDRTLATVSDGVKTQLITLSDLRWQLALQPGKQIDPPTQTDLDEVLRLVIDQRILALEAERLPRNAPTEAEITAEIVEILAYFPSTAEFERRLRIVGFSSVSDDNFERLIAQRVAINSYLDFRFRSFVVITREDEEQYYNQVYVPEFRKNNPGQVVQVLDRVRPVINENLKEETVAANIDSFLEDARRRVEIVMLNGN